MSFFLDFSYDKTSIYQQGRNGGIWGPKEKTETGPLDSDLTKSMLNTKAGYKNEILSC